MELVLKIAKVYKLGITTGFQQWKRILLPCILLAIWHGITVSGMVKPILLPSPAQVFDAFVAMLSTGELVTHLGTSMIRVVEGFFLAALLGVGLGLGLGIFPLMFELMDGLIQLLRPIPPIAWLPLAILWFGIEEGSKIFIIVIGAFFPIFINVLDGIRQTDHKFVELSQVLEVPRRKFITKVVIPGALPFIISGLRVGLGYAWMCVVAAELSAGMKGIGYMLTDARALAQTDRVLVGMLAIGVVGKIMDSLLRVIEKKIIRWKESFTGV
ncbi:ABC transporter permease [Sporomusa acidovorans]|uniref:Aliphatic sulfonates transport permease protein SsuC n=1 Tax=Sporomusa acidovorans (strain ATCC 49682 / DSM 3132 / Mol) TaxID=1123286 RepID=A0ABZ3IY03_SPOA4|nr:ABC transporter permease [Sporomusa acidovorans]OZC23355.1 putative aliphatic sulfonates transport permease protein SsuC [Sporomusa acidovorans DSM 3132]SDE42835.1 sulfonate transport system permease protein [Sporomusa acidovorans]